MTTNNNPASRLLAILVAARTGKGDDRMLEVWASVLGVESADPMKVARHLTVLADTVDEVERLIQAQPDLNSAPFLSGFPVIRDAISPIHLGSKRDVTIHSHITPDVLARLEFCDERLVRVSPEDLISKEDLAEIATAANELVELVARTVEDPHLRLALLDALEQVRLAISAYRAGGATRLRRTVAQFAGILHGQRDELRREKTKNADVFERLGLWLNRVDSLASKATNVYNVFRRPVLGLLGLASKALSSPEKTDDAADEGPEIIDA